MEEDKTPYPSDVADKFLLRLPDGMRDKLKAAAKANSRTMNGEIVARLETSLQTSPPDEMDPAVVKVISDTITETMRQMYESGWRPLTPNEPPGESPGIVSSAVQAGAIVAAKSEGKNPFPDVAEETLAREEAKRTKKPARKSNIVRRPT